MKKKLKILICVVLSLILPTLVINDRLNKKEICVRESTITSVVYQDDTHSTVKLSNGNLTVVSNDSFKIGKTICLETKLVGNSIFN